MSEMLKAELLDEGHWRICAIPFGGPLKGGRDLDREFFSPRTDIKPDWFAQRPVLFHHGLDRRIKDAQVGREGPLTKREDGWWADMWLDQQSEYFDVLNELIAAGKMYGSSGAIAHLVRKSHDGEILVWPHAEQTITLTPSNVYARVTAAKAFGDFSSAGIATEGFKSLLADLDALTDDLRLTSETGDDAAMTDARLASVLDELEDVLRNV